MLAQHFISREKKKIYTIVNNAKTLNNIDRDFPCIKSVVPVVESQPHSCLEWKKSKTGTSSKSDRKSL